MNYQIKFYLQIKELNTNGFIFEYDLELPFLPFIGLEVYDSKWCAKINELHWDCQRNKFIAYVPPNKEIINEALQQCGNSRKLLFNSVTKLITQYLDLGWKLSLESQKYYDDYIGKEVMNKIYKDSKKVNYEKIN